MNDLGVLTRAINGQKSPYDASFLVQTSADLIHVQRSKCWLYGMEDTTSMYLKFFDSIVWRDRSRGLELETKYDTSHLEVEHVLYEALSGSGCLCVKFYHKATKMRFWAFNVRLSGSQGCNELCTLVDQVNPADALPFIVSGDFENLDQRDRLALSQHMHIVSPFVADGRALILTSKSHRGLQVKYDTAKLEHAEDGGYDASQVCFTTM
jgi:hypothetical protein